MIRIISGERRGAKILTPDGETTRPLRDRIREALFSSLRADVRDSVVLDAFAGSGAVGLEALSNGATHATFIDNSAPAIAVIKSNLQKLRFEDRATVLTGECPAALHSTGAAPKFTLLFLMPPYHSGLCQLVLASDVTAARTHDKAIAVCEIHTDEAFEIPDGWQLVKEKKYGITRLLFLGRAAPLVLS